MKGQPIKASVLSVKIIPNASPMLLDKLKIDHSKRSLGIITTDSDDVGYTALDEATKQASVIVAYAQSMYAGAGNASTKLAGEFIGILAGETPDEVKSALDSAINCIENEATFYSANDDDSIVYYAHCISRTGAYLSKNAGVAEGTAMAYLIAPPLEAIVALDAALKASDVKIMVFYEPPSFTNFAGGLLVGDQAACKAACEAFSKKVCEIAQSPLSY